MNAMPTWLAAALVETGVLSESGLTRTARVRRHRPCGIPTLAGISSLGLDAWCELLEITAAGEALALLDGRATYWIHAGQIVHRDQWTISGRPAESERAPAVLVEHRCDARVPASWVATPRHVVAPNRVKGETACQF